MFVQSKIPEGRSVTDKSEVLQYQKYNSVRNYKRYLLIQGALKVWKTDFQAMSFSQNK